MSLFPNNRHDRNRVLVAMVLFVILVAAFLTFTENDAEGVVPEPCVPSEAIPEVPGTPAIPAVPEVPAVTETVVTPATPDLWWNWSPNKDQGPFEGPPAFPLDERGTWQGPHKNGGPEQDTYGTFNTSNNDNGNASWFHREHGTPETTEVVIITPAIPGVPEVPAVPGTPAVPAVVCPDPPLVTPTVPTETPTVPTETPTVPTETETTPTDVETVPLPEPSETPSDEPKDPTTSSSTLECVDGVWVTTVDGEVVSETGTCAQSKKRTVTALTEVAEEGM